MSEVLHTTTTRLCSEGVLISVSSDCLQETSTAIKHFAHIQDLDVLAYGTYMVLGANQLKGVKKATDALGNIGKVCGTCRKKAGKPNYQCMA